MVTAPAAGNNHEPRPWGATDTLGVSLVGAVYVLLGGNFFPSLPVSIRTSADRSSVVNPAASFASRVRAAEGEASESASDFTSSVGEMCEFARVIGGLFDACRAYLTRLPAHSPPAA